MPHDACLLCRHCLCSRPGKKMSDGQLWRAQLGAEKGGPCILGEGGNWRESASIHRGSPDTREGKGIFHTFLLAPQYIQAGLWQFTWGVTSLGPGKKMLKRRKFHQAPKRWLQAQQHGWKGTEMSVSHRCRVTSERGYQLVPSQSGFRRSCWSC